MSPNAAKRRSGSATLPESVRIAHARLAKRPGVWEARAPCWRPRAPLTLHPAWAPAGRQRGGGEARAPHSRSRAHLPARCAAPAVSSPGEMQPTFFTWLRTQPKSPEGRRVRRDAQCLLKREENESDGDGEPFLPRLRLSAEPWGSRRESAVISKTSLRKLHFPVRFYYLRQNRCWLDSVLESSCTGNDYFLWGFPENASDGVWHIPGTHVGPALKVPWQDQPQNTPRARHDLTCWGPIPACALPGVLVLMWALPGDTSSTCGLTVTSRCLRPRCWCCLLQHLLPLLLAPRMGTSFSAVRGTFTRGCTWWASRPQHPPSWQYLTKVWVRCLKSQHSHSLLEPDKYKINLVSLQCPRERLQKMCEDNKCCWDGARMRIS